jgi:hypothetical protein
MADEKPAPDPEAVAAWQVPAPLSNKVYIYFDGHTVRIVFAEQGGPDLPAAVRSAVALVPQTAIEFSKLLRGMLAPVEEALTKAQEEATAKAQQAVAKTKDG